MISSRLGLPFVFATLSACGMNGPTVHGVVRDHDQALEALATTANAHRSAMATLADMAVIRSVERNHSVDMSAAVARMRSAIESAGACQPGACAGEPAMMDALTAEMTAHQAHMEACTSAEDAAAEEARHSAMMDEMMAGLTSSSDAMHTAMCEQMMQGSSGMMGGGMMGGSSTMGGDHGSDASDCASMDHDAMMSMMDEMDMPCSEHP